ncbi:variable surface protein, partial [Plasmodium gonderi]
CTYDNYDYYNITFEDFRNIKKLFDFSKDYDMLKEYISKGNRFCNKDFYDYVIPYIITYNLFKSQCKNGNRGEATCSAFYNYFNDKTEEDLSQWTFTLDKRNTNNVTQKEAHGRVSQPNVQGINIVEEHKSEKILGHEINTNPYIYQSVYESTEIKHLNDQQSEDFYSVHRTQELRAHIDMSVSPSGSTSKSLVIPPLAIGITVFSIILCKFTPIGYWLKKALVGKSKTKRNIIMDSNIEVDYSMYKNLESPRRFNLSYRNI